MADNTGRVLDLIDGAIRDNVSPDAMRWVPEDERIGDPADHPAAAAYIAPPRAPFPSPLAYWPHEQPPESGPYGTAELREHPDGTITVIHADRVIGVTIELWDNMRPPYRQPDDTLWLDTAGEYQYRFVRHEYVPEMLVFARIEGEAT